MGPVGNIPIIVYQPAAVNPLPPVYSDWNKVENLVNTLQGAAQIIVDATGTSDFKAHVPATAALDGKGRLKILGVGADEETRMVIDNGGQIKNVREWRSINLLSATTTVPPVRYDIDGIAVECFDTTFISETGATQPLVSFPGNNPGGYGILLMYGSSEFIRAAGTPPLLSLGNGFLLLWGLGVLWFGASFDGMVSGPASAQIQVQTDASLPATFSWPDFLGSVQFVQIDRAPGLAYTPGVPPNWASPPPTNMQQAADRMAALLVTLNAGNPIP
jgi:hypothetical protein